MTVLPMTRIWRTNTRARGSSSRSGRGTGGQIRSGGGWAWAGVYGRPRATRPTDSQASRAARNGRSLGPTTVRSSGGLPRAPGIQRQPRNPEERFPPGLFFARQTQGVCPPLSDERARPETAPLERGPPPAPRPPTTPHAHQTARLPPGQPCRAGSGQEPGGLQDRLRQARQRPADIGDVRLNVDLARGAQGRRGGNQAVRGQVDLGRDVDIAPRPAEGVGVNPARIEHDELRGDGDVAALAD